MISLLGSLFSFGSSLVGPVLEAWNKSSDQKHELAMLQAQAELQSKIQDQKLEATIVEADMAEIVAAHKEQASTVRKGPQWLAALSALTHLALAASSGTVAALLVVYKSFVILVSTFPK